MNDLEQWLADVKQFNMDVGEFTRDWMAISKAHHDIEERGRALGLKRSKIKSMLASVRLKVEMPEDVDAPQA